MNAFIKKSIIYLVVFFFLGNIIALGGKYFLSKSLFYKSTFIANTDIPKSLDYFIVGSSRGLTTLDSKLIDSSLKVNGINLSMDDTDLKTHLLMMKHFFDLGYSSKYCILTLDDNHFTKTNPELGKNDYRFIPFANKKYVQEHYSSYETSNVKVLSSSNYFPLFAFSYYNLELFFPSVLSVVKPNYRNKFDEKGNYSYPVLNNFKINKSEKRIIKDLIITNPLLNEIQLLLNKNNCKLIVFIAPYFNRDYINKSDYEFDLINFSNIVNSDKLFYDNIHVNEGGRLLTTNLFIKRIKDKLK